MSINKFLRAFLIILVILVLSSCHNDNPNTENETAENSNKTDPFFVSEQLNDTEVEILEEITGKEINQISEDDLLAVNTINIIGKNISVSSYKKSFSKEGYVYNGTLLPYGDDLGSSLSILNNFSNLHTLGIYFCESLNNVSFLGALTNLEELTVVMTSVTDFSVLQKLENLSYLEIRCSPVDTIAFSNSDMLKHIYISNSNISDLTPFEHLLNLEVFSLIFNRAEISETDALCSLEKLNTLELIAPNYDLYFISKLNAPSLTKLVLGGYDNIDLQQICSISSQLSSFQLKNSNSTDLTPLDSLPDDCSIQISLSENCIHGKRTTNGASRYSYSSISHDIFDWYYEN